ncbi:MAG: amylo-alpha-1,6-glucosidase [Victivallales bacterium]|nr:amylo-alpha-1,6-glucosidase [Victivallales bacterium]
MKQEIVPALKIFTRGDGIVFRLTMVREEEGTAFLRTNLGRAAIRRQEIIDYNDKNQPVLDHDWHDLPMVRKSRYGWEIKLPLIEVGCFEAKCWFLRAADNEPVWAEGKNFRLKVEPSGNVCGNTLYTVFPRQFGRNIAACRETAPETEARQLLDGLGYTVIPPSGTFRDVIRRLDFIIGELRSRIIQLLPVHPAPTIYGRMGRYGSPFAALDYFDVDPALAEFDEDTTPLDQFMELVDAVHARSARLFLDIPVNHTGWASRLHTEHPEWFARNPDGSFQSPGAWGVIWADLCKLDYRRHEVHTLMADIFLYWCRRGVDGFRCDAGYMLPPEAWKYITARVRREYPDTVFLLEGLGGGMDIQEKLLSETGLNWAYSELFQNYTRQQIEHYYPYAARMSLNCGCFVSYAETHDNPRLAAKSPLYARMRTALCALLSHHGAFGITNGVEWFATEQIRVHEAGSLNWGSSENQTEAIRRLQILLETHPAFFAGSATELIEADWGEVLALRRRSGTERQLLVLINLDVKSALPVSWPAREFPAGDRVFDLLTGREYEFFRRGRLAELHLEPGQALCLSPRREDLAEFEAALQVHQIEPPAVTRQRERATLFQAYVHYHGYGDVSGADVDALLLKFVSSPEKLGAQLAGLDLPDMTLWQDGADQRRTVMVPAGDLLLVKCPSPFRAEVKNGDFTEAAAVSLPLSGGGNFALITGLTNPAAKAWKRELKLRIFETGKVRQEIGELKLLPKPEQVRFRHIFEGREAVKKHLYALCSNDLGGMSQVRAEWGAVRSKYDALLAANCNADYPVDRRVMFTRCRAWLVCSDYSRELNASCLESFTAGSGNAARWRFRVPSGQGKNVPLTITLMMPERGNAVKLTVSRLESAADSELPGAIPVKIILRPDLEDRDNHQLTRAMDGAENHFRNSVSGFNRGFEFNPSRRHCLKLKLDRGTFVRQMEWLYMVELPVEHDRGLEYHTDLFSPGYFEFKLKAGESSTLLAAVDPAGDGEDVHESNFNWDDCTLSGLAEPEAAFYRGLWRFIVRRDQYRTVIAGYPWFLDWGRDTLICLRGLIAAGFMSEARDIILQFAAFERQGTIPNMIRGKDDSDRDTSDAPLWLFIAVRDYCRAAGNEALLDEKCGKRTVLEILFSIAENYYRGTPNGIAADQASGLVFSPPHFTWMDTNYPVCTPRAGYPVEIQALWIAALELLSARDENWRKIRERACRSLQQLFRLPDRLYLSDCLHAESGTPAAAAVPDDACRPNQLLAVTLNCIEDGVLRKNIVQSCETLLVPGAIRSLADARVDFKQPVTWQGKLLNDPARPFWPEYRGDEDTRRKPAYHNGTAWTWLFPSWCEALMLVAGKKAAGRALGILLSCRELFESGTPGQIPEIVDGGIPHAWRGCGAQAWGISELYRVYKLLKQGGNVEKN